MQLNTFEMSDLLADLPEAFCLTRLTLQILQLRLQRLHDIVQAFHVSFRRAQAQFGLVPPGMQASDAGGLFQQGPAVNRFGVDNLANATLADQGRRMCPGRRIREQQLHITGPHFVAVDPVSGTAVPFNCAGHFQFIRIVEDSGRRAVFVFDYQGDLGQIAAAAVLRTVENHIVHSAAAHAFGRIFPHHPAQGFHQIGFAAAIGPDHAGQARFNK